MKVLSTLNFGSFPGKILFSAGFNYSEVCEELKKQKSYGWLQAFYTCEQYTQPDVAGFSAVRRTTIKGNEYEYCFLFLRDIFNFSDRHHAVLSHETIHMCTHALSPMFDIVKENEAFAYTHTHILTQCYKVMRDARNKRKK